VEAGEEGALDPAMFTTCRAFARAVLERRRGGERVKVMVSPSDRTLDLRRPWRARERCFP